MIYCIYLLIHRHKCIIIIIIRLINLMHVINNYSMRVVHADGHILNAENTLRVFHNVHY